MFKKIAVIFAALIVMFGPALTQAQATQLNSTASGVSLSMSVSESITVSATPSSVVFTYNSGAGTATTPTTINVTTNWNANGSRLQVGTVAYLGSSSAALSGPSNIPSGNVNASINGGTAQPCNNADNLVKVSNSLTATGLGTASTMCPLVFENSTGGLT